MRELHDVDYDNPKDFSLAEQKEALMTNKFLSHRLRGTFHLYDEKTGELLDKQPTTLMRVPYLSDRGTFIHNGSEYSTINQARLMPGAYTRRRDSGQVETHFNAKRGTGASFHVLLEPETGLFRLNIGQAKLRLYSLLHDIGVPDEELEKAWGPELLKVNKDAYDKRIFDKAYERLVRFPDQNATPAQKAAAIRDALASTKLSREVMERTLPSSLHKSAAAQNSPDVEGPVQPVGPETESNTSGNPGGFTAIGGGAESEESGLRKDDLIGIALLLNRDYGAGIPLNESLEQLGEDIRQVVTAALPGLHPDLVAAFSGGREDAVYAGKTAGTLPGAEETFDSQGLSAGTTVSEKQATKSTKEIDAAAHEAATSPKNDLPEPTPAQRRAGVYRMGHIWVHGMNISIENPKGSVRSGTARNGRAGI